MRTKSFRSRVMKYAHRIFTSCHLAWSTCLKKAWKVYYLCKDMRQGVVRFFYTKTDGTIREAYGTLKDLPAGASINGKRVTKPSYKTVAYYDVERRAYRCFRTENLL